VTKSVVELLEELRSLDESSRIEAKLANEIGPSVHQTICAFANEPNLGGGTLLLGIEKDEGAHSTTYRVVGVHDPDKLQRDVISQCNSIFNRRVDIDVWVELVEGQRVVAIQVEEAAQEDKPIFLTKVGLPKGAYRRKGSADIACTEHEIRELYAARDAAEDAALSDADLEDLDDLALREYLRRLSEVNPGSEILQWPSEDIVKSLGCIVRRQGQFVPTLAGILLFGKQTSLRRLLPMVRIDYIRVPGTTWVPDASRRYTGLEIRAPLLLAYQRAYSTILEDLPGVFSLPVGSPHAKTTPPIPERVIREALANCLIHRNYRVHQPVQIIRWANRIEIINPGYSLIDESRLGEPGSRTRNPRISTVFHDLHLAENKGTGIQAMRREMQAAHLTPPTFESDRDNDQFKVTLRLHHLLADEERAWLASFWRLSLSNHEVMALLQARQTGSVRNETLRQLTGLDTLAASKVLARLRNEKLLEPQGRGSTTSYAPTERLLFPERFPEFTPVTPPALTSPSTSTLELPFGSAELAPVGASTQSPPSVQELADETQGLPGETQGFPFETRGLPDETQGFPDETQRLPGETQGLPGETQGLPGETQGLGLPPDVVEQLATAGRNRERVTRAILTACAVRPLLPRELVRLLRRKDINHLVEHHLAPLVDQGKLERTHPENPSHPDQAYRTRK
jgi:ATP-dependent DNA helicase RecG